MGGLSPAPSPLVVVVAEFAWIGLPFSLSASSFSVWRARPFEASLVTVYSGCWGGEAMEPLVWESVAGSEGGVGLWTAGRTEMDSPCICEAIAEVILCSCVDCGPGWGRAAIDGGAVDGAVAGEGIWAGVGRSCVGAGVGVGSVMGGGRLCSEGGSSAAGWAVGSAAVG